MTKESLFSGILMFAMGISITHALDKHYNTATAQSSPFSYVDSGLIVKKPLISGFQKASLDQKININGFFVNNNQTGNGYVQGQLEITADKLEGYLNYNENGVNKTIYINGNVFSEGQDKNVNFSVYGGQNIFNMSKSLFLPID